VVAAQLALRKAEGQLAATQYSVPLHQVAVVAAAVTTQKMAAMVVLAVVLAVLAPQAAPHQVVKETMVATQQATPRVEQEAVGLEPLAKMVKHHIVVVLAVLAWRLQ